MRKLLVATVAGFSVITFAASASTASQREFKRGFSDCSAGRYDRERHGASYKAGCDAAEAKRGPGGAAPVAEAPAAPVQQADFFMDPRVPGKDKEACIRAVRKETANPKAVVMGAVSSEANNQVTIGVGPQRAPWKCLVKRGRVAEVMSQTDEGGL